MLRLIIEAMSVGRPDDLQQQVIEFARATEVPEDSFLMRRMPLNDAEQVQSIIDGLTLALISYSYHRHPRGENVHEVMDELDRVKQGTDEHSELERRADDALALQIPFLVTLNKLLEDYYHLRHELEARLQTR